MDDQSDAIGARSGPHSHVAVISSYQALLRRKVLPAHLHSSDFWHWRTDQPD